DGGARDGLQVGVLRRREVEHHIVARRGRAGKLDAVDVDGRGLVDHVEGEGDVSWGERLAVVPLHALTDREGERLAGVGPRVQRGQPRVVLGRGDQVELDERLIDKTGGAPAVTR